MKRLRSLRVPATLGAGMLLGSLLLFAGCSPTGGGGGAGGGNGQTPTNDNAAGNVNENANGGEPELGEADVTFPDNGDAFMIIEELEGVGSATYYGSTDEATGDVTMWGFVADTGDGDFAVSVDEQGRPEEIVIDSIIVTITYNADDSLNYEITDGGELLYSGTGIVVEQDATEWAARASKGVSRDEVALDVFYTLIAALEHVTGAVVLGDNPVNACVQANPVAIRLAEMVCVCKNVLLPRLQDSTGLCQKLCQRQTSLEPDCVNRCVQKMQLAEVAMSWYLLDLQCLTLDVVRDIKSYYEAHQRCPGEEQGGNGDGGGNDNGGGGDGNGNDNGDGDGGGDGTDEAQCDGAQYFSIISVEKKEYGGNNCSGHWVVNTTAPVTVMVHIVHDFAPGGGVDTEETTGIWLAGDLSAYELSIPAFVSQQQTNGIYTKTTEVIFVLLDDEDCSWIADEYLETGQIPEGITKNPVSVSNPCGG